MDNTVEKKTSVDYIDFRFFFISFYYAVRLFLFYRIPCLVDRDDVWN